MKKLVVSLILFSVISLFGGIKNGDSAPDFTLQDAAGKSVSLSDFSGKTVVLEWINPGCPFVRKFYTNQDMGNMQKKADEMDVVWLSINSTNPDHGDFLSPSESLEWAKENGHSATWLLDSDGNVGQSYGARTTPHMFIVNPEGKVVYQGAIDSIRDADPKSISEATNYVMQALTAMQADRELPEAQTRPYGCSVKY